jgi:hypothetical protein
MKKIISIIAISIILFGCTSSNNNTDNSGEEIAVVKKNDTKSNKISDLIKSFENRDLSIANTLFDDSLKVFSGKNASWFDNDYFKDTTYCLGKKEFLNDFDSVFVWFDSMKISKPRIQTQYNVNGDVITIILAYWCANGKLTKTKYRLPYHKIYKWKGDKVIEVIEITSNKPEAENPDPYGYNLYSDSAYIASLSRNIVNPKSDTTKKKKN